MYQFSKIFYEADAGAKTGGGATEPLATEPVGTEPQDKTFSQKDVDAIIAKQKTAFERMTEKKLEGFKQAEKLKVCQKAKGRLKEANTGKAERVRNKSSPISMKRSLPQRLTDRFCQSHTSIRRRRSKGGG